MTNRYFFTSRGAYVNLRYIIDFLILLIPTPLVSVLFAHFLCFFTVIRLEISSRTRWWCLKSGIVYPARDIPAFVMYCINGESGTSLLIESTDSMIFYSLPTLRYFTVITIRYNIYGYTLI